jgi:hypothetical protein
VCVITATTSLTSRDITRSGNVGVDAVRCVYDNCIQSCTFMSLNAFQHVYSVSELPSLMWRSICGCVSTSVWDMDCHQQRTFPRQGRCRHAGR